MEVPMNDLLNPQDATRLEDIRREIAKAWEAGRPIPYFTPHDQNHSQMVEDLILKALPPDAMRRGLSDNERFILLAAAWFHDVGMNPELFDTDKRGLPPDKTKEWDRTVRMSHAKRSADYVVKMGPRLGLSRDEINLLEKMARLHRYGAYRDLHQEEWEQRDVRLPLLASYLRLADALHIPRRDEHTSFKIFLALGMDHKAKFHWLKSKYADRVELSPTQSRITLVMRRRRGYTKDAWKQKTRDLQNLVVREVQDELDAVKDILARGGLAYYHTVEADSDEDATFSANEERELDELLRRMRLFDPTLSPNASSAAGDILKLLTLFSGPGGDEDTAIGLLEDYQQHALQEFLNERPCHVFPRRIAADLQEILEGHGLTPRKRLTAVRAKIKEWQSKRRKIRDDLPAKALDFLKGSAPILVYGLSESVARCLKGLPPQDKRETEVYVCEGRPKTEHRHNNRLVSCDGVRYGEALRAAGFRKENVILVADACTSHLFSTRPGIRVVFGANGIGRDGRIGHTLGHLTIADAARSYDVPVYVIADTLKIGDLDARPDLMRGNRWLTTDIAWESRVNDMSVLNPREDVVPPDRITAIITERGVVRPQDIGSLVE
jgi:translation initiation factor 2B subunit (eIF-2B alpha/beta/delta family)